MKIILGDFGAKLWRDYIFKLTIGIASLHEDSKDNGVRVTNLATKKSNCPSLKHS
jgi:hypothetical protein